MILDDTGLSFLIIFIMGMVVIVVFAAIQSSKASLRSLRKSHEGDVVRRGMVKVFQVHRPAFDVEVTLSELVATIIPRGRFTGHLQVHQEGFADPISAMFGGPDLQIGDREFDALYTVRGQCSQEFARSILTPDVVFIIRELGKSGSVVFTLTPSKVEIRTASSFVSNHAKLLDYAIRIGSC